MEKQRTINKPVSFSGTGLHTGNPSTITFHPAPENYGYVFVRTDLKKHVEIPALVDYVVDLSRGTTLGKNNIKVHTVEHVLAALAGLKIDNCKIELSANEPPVVDGSSMPYVKALLEAGIKEQNAERKYLEIDETIRYTNEEKHVDIVALPTDGFRVTVMIDYFNPALGSQHTGLFDLEEEFIKEFASARTFCFLTEVETLYKQGLIKGGSLESALVIVDKDIEKGEMENLGGLFNLSSIPEAGSNGYLNNTELRFKNEPARHKLLDMIGDLSLVGVPIKAQILAARPGHASNYEFAKKLRAVYLKKLSQESKIKQKDFVQDINKIMSILPHRYPFLMIDRMTGFDTDTITIKGFKNITINEPFFEGHFPEKPIMPGVLILEALAQVGGMLLFNHLKFEEIDNKIALFMGINNSKFRRPVVPGDKLEMTVQLINRRFNVFMFKGTAEVDGQLAAESEFQAALVDK